MCLDYLHSPVVLRQMFLGSPRVPGPGLGIEDTEVGSGDQDSALSSFHCGGCWVATVRSWQGRCLQWPRAKALQCAWVTHPKSGVGCPRSPGQAGYGAGT